MFTVLFCFKFENLSMGRMGAQRKTVIFCDQVVTWASRNKYGSWWTALKNMAPRARKEAGRAIMKLEK
jgi:hypothetical protein